MGRQSKTQWRTYLQAIVLNRLKTGALTEDQSQELATIARALDELGEGGLDQLADLLVQRFKSLEARGMGNKRLGSSIELVGEEDSGLVSRKELVAANRAQLQDRKLRSFS